jgi:dihydropteroate synthase
MGAAIINDISSLQFDPKMAEVVRHFDAGIVLMHMRGEPATMHLQEESEDILSEIKNDLKKSVRRAVESGISHDRIIIDPGIGFGKNARENLQILNRLTFLNELDIPILVGPSRKRFIGRILGVPKNDRLLGTAAASAAAVMNGAHILRVHDVAEIKQISRMIDAIGTESTD